MFWDKVAWVYDTFADVINRKANKKICAIVEAQITPADEVLECAANLSGLRAYVGIFSGEDAELLKGRSFFDARKKNLRLIRILTKGSWRGIIICE